MSNQSLVFFTLVNILNYLDRYIFGAIQPLIQVDLGLSQSEAGWLFSAFVPGYVIFSPIFGYLGDRHSRPRLMCLGVFLWSLATIASSFATSFWALYLCRALVGVGEASFSSIAPGYLKDCINNPLKINSALSIFFAAIPVGSALGFVTGGLVAANHPWHTALLVGGLPGLILPWFLLRYPEVRTSVPTSESLFAGFKQIFQLKVLWIIAIGYCLNSFALNGLASFVTTYGLSIGFSIDKISMYAGLLLCLAGFIGTFFGGRCASSLGKRARGEFELVRFLLRFVGITSIIGAPFILIAFNFSQPIAFLGTLFLAELFIFASVAPINTAIVLSSPAKYVTLCQGLSIFALNVFGSLPAPGIVGKVVDLWSIRVAMMALSVPLLLSGVVWLAGGIGRKVRRG